MCTAQSREALCVLHSLEGHCVCVQHSLERHSLFTARYSVTVQYVDKPKPHKFSCVLADIQRRAGEYCRCRVASLIDLFSAFDCSLCLENGADMPTSPEYVNNYH